MNSSLRTSKGQAETSDIPQNPDLKPISKGSRRKSREAALQALFLVEMNPINPMDLSLAVFLENFPVKKGSEPYFFRLIQGVGEQKEAIDRLIMNYTENWRIERMSGVDRNILRIAVFELVYCNDIPPRVAINEAIDLGKQYGTEESGAFINGILDRIFLEQYGKSEANGEKVAPT
jgi:transcription antitermination protein NusB